MNLPAMGKANSTQGSFVFGALKGRRILLLFYLLAVGVPPVRGNPYGLDSRPASGAFLNGAMPETAPAISGDWSAVVAFPNLLFTNAVGLTSVPGTNELCVWEREGRVWTFENNPGVPQKKLVLDVHHQCQGWDDSGLLGVAFHPGFATNHYPPSRLDNGGFFLKLLECRWPTNLWLSRADISGRA